MKKIAVFCSASANIDHVYMEKAEEFGAWMGQHDKWLIYGGTNMGLMNVLASATKANGGFVMGVVPTIVEERGRVSDLLDVTFRTENLSDRKDVMLREADIAVALPGGVGTLDEIFHVMAAATIGYHHKQVVLYNVNGFWNGIIEFLRGLEEQRFAHNPLDNYFKVANSFDELVNILDN